MGLLLFYLLLSLSLSSLCSVLEAVLLASTVSYVTIKEQEGFKIASVLKRYKADIDRPIAAILSLNTIAHTVGAAGVGAQAAELWREYGGAPGSEGDAVGIASAIMTLLILVVSEILPKVIGATYWRQLALWATRVIRVLIVIMYPLVLLSEFITILINRGKVQTSVSREEVQAMMDVGVEEGVFKAKESKALRSFLKLGEIRADEIMTPAPVVGEFFRSDDEHLDLHSRLPVYDAEEEYIKGYVLRSELLEGLSEDHFAQEISTLVRPILTFKDEEMVSNIWEKMLEQKEHIAVITDEYGTLRGIVTMEDLIETMLGVEIVDEYDEAVDMQDMAREKWQQQQLQNPEPAQA